LPVHRTPHTDPHPIVGKISSRQSAQRLTSIPISHFHAIAMPGVLWRPNPSCSVASDLDLPALSRSRNSWLWLCSCGLRASAPDTSRTCDLRFRNSTQSSAPSGHCGALSDNSADFDVEQSAPQCNIGAPSDAPRETVTQSAGIPQLCDPPREGMQTSDKSRRPSRGEIMAALVGLWCGDTSAAEALLAALLDE